jgi:hypothetical protein
MQRVLRRVHSGIVSCGGARSLSTMSVRPMSRGIESRQLRRRAVDAERERGMAVVPRNDAFQDVQWELFVRAHESLGGQACVLCIAASAAYLSLDGDAKAEVMTEVELIRYVTCVVSARVRGCWQR